jgi:DNA-binding transcriptional LysR family regulator
MKSTRHWAGLELRHLLALEAVAAHGSFHKAGAHLDYTQSGISQQIAGLESIVGERLIERPGGSRPVRLTEAGQVLLRHAGVVLERVEAARADVAALREGRAGALRVGAFQSVGMKLLPAVIRRLSAERPQLRVELTQTTSDPRLFALLAEGGLDITFAMLPLPEGPFASVELFADPFVLMAAADSPLAQRGGAVSLRELSGVPLIASHGCRYTSHLEAQMRERGLNATVAHRTDDNGTVHGLVAAGAGVALVPRLVAESASEDVTVIELEEWLPPRRIALSWRGDRELPRTREVFVTAVREATEALGLGASA